MMNDINEVSESVEADEFEESQSINNETKQNEQKPELQLQKTVDEIINNYFAITKVKLTPDDPTVGMLLAQRIDLDAQLKDFKNSLNNIFDEAKNQTNGRLTEIDKHYHQALKIATELKNQRERLLSELSVHHQKNIIDFAGEINDRINKSSSKINFLLFTTIGATISSVAALFVLIRLIT